MGRAIETFALTRKHVIAGKIDPAKGLSFDFTQPVDVAIEFTQPESAAANIRLCLDKGVPVLSGTTGWLDQMAAIREHCGNVKGTFFYASNFSLGVNLFFKLNEYLAGLMSTRDQYDVDIEETHHTQKKDAPSGTAITLAETILRKFKSKKKWVRESGQPGDLIIRSFRRDPVAGTHIVKYNSADDTIDIVHTAHSREGFARGAVMVAEWLPGHKGVLGMDDFLKL